MAERQQAKNRVSDTKNPNAIPLNSLPRKRVQDFLRVYASVVNTTATPFDISLIFGHPFIGAPDESYLEQTVSVTMSWHAVKSLAQLLDRMIEKYERETGEIKMPPQSDQPSSE